MKIAFFLSSFLLSTALSTTSVQTSPASQSNNSIISDVTYYGLYKIVNCRSDLPARLYPEAAQLRNFLGEAWNSTRLLLADVNNGTNSRYGFGPLFKSNSSITPVTFTVWSIMNGGDVGPTNVVPTLLCLDGYSTNPAVQSLYEETCTPGVTTTVIPNSSYLGFCPSFFEASKRNLDFPISLDCPSVDTSKNLVEEKAHPLMHNMYPIFLSEMLKLHLQVSAESAQNQVHRVQDCINLNATASLANVANLAYYAASVHAGCTDWPTVPLADAIEGGAK